MTLITMVLVTILSPLSNQMLASLTWGNSTEDRFGCPDADGDGWSDEETFSI